MNRPQYQLRVDEIRVFYDVVEATVQTEFFHSLYKMMFCAMLYALCVHLKPATFVMDTPPPLSSYRPSMQFIIGPDISEKVPSFHLDQVKVILILKVHPDLLRGTKVTSKLYCHFRADISLLVNGAEGRTQFLGSLRLC